MSHLRVRRFFISAVVPFILSLALVEGGLRVYARFRPNFIFFDASSVPYDRFRGKPHAMDWDFQLNSYGFKSHEFSPAKKPGVFRILGLGDSFVFGVVPYRHNFLTLIHRSLQRKGYAAEIINMGIPSIGPTDYLMLLTREGLDLDPDLVIVHFFIGNDFDVRPLKLDHPVYTWSFVRYLWATSRHFEGFHHGNRVYRDDTPTFTESAFLEIESQRAHSFDARDPFLSAQIPIAVSPLLKIKEVLAQRKIRLLVVLIPAEVQVDDSLWDKIVSIHGGSSAAMDRERPNRLLASALREAGIDTLDLLPAFRHEGRKARLYRPRDTHWNISGNALAATVLEAEIQRFLPVPKHAKE